MTTSVPVRPPARGPSVIHTPDQRLRVFVSSTLKELRRERVAVRAAVTRLRLTPVMFESAARPHPPSELYRAYERQSDVFVGVYWRSYGRVAPGAGVSGIEDEWALAEDLPRLVYLKEPGTGREPRLTDLISRIRDDAGTSYRSFRTPQELQEMVENDLALMLTDRFLAAPDIEPEPEQEQAAGSRLPAPVTCLVGRSEEVEAVGALLAHDEVRLVTLTGPGGIGKSRLALEVARRAETGFPDGVRFIDLAATTRPELVATAVLDQLGVGSPSTAEPAPARLTRALRTRRLLLVLDNFEQVTEAAPLVTDLLAGSPGITVLVTSRTVLHLRGEHAVVVAGLGVGPPHGAPPGDLTPAAEDAVQLFAVRARAVAPQFRLDAQNLAAVAEICRRLDGLPLAIELAASRVRMLPPNALLHRLRDGLGLVGAGPVDAPPRQRTLEGTITWSHDLLTSDERRVLAATSVFSGGFDLRAAEALNGRGDDPGSPDTLRTLGSLVDKSLLHVSVDDDGHRRFGLLQIIREYAAERLEECGGRDRARDAHAAHYLSVAESAGRGLRGENQRAWLRRLARDHDNLRAAMTWDLERGDVESALRISWGIWIFWWFGHIDEGAAWFASVRATGSQITTYQHAQALAGAGLMGFAGGDRRAAETVLQQALSLYREVGDRPGTALATGTLGHLSTGSGDLQQAELLLGESLRLYRDLGDDWYLAIMLNFRGCLSEARYEHARAAGEFAEALALSRQVGGSVPLLISLYNSGVTELARDDSDAAAIHFTEGLDRAVEVGDPASASPYLFGMAATTSTRDPERAARLVGAAEEMRAAAAGTVWMDAYTLRPAGSRSHDALLDATSSAQVRARSQGRAIAASSSAWDMTRLARLASTPERAST